MSFKALVTGICFLFLILSFKISRAQSDSTAIELPVETFDTAYLTDYTNLLTTRLFLAFQNASLLVNTYDENISKIVFRPNVNVRIGIAGFWKWFGLGLSIDNPFYNTDRSLYGKTSTLDLRVNAFGRMVAGELFFQEYKGYYISSPERKDDTYFIIPDMQTISLGIAGYWIYNAKRFSIRAAFIQNERQKKSAGSLLVRPAFLYYRISSDQGIIPPELMATYHIPSSNVITNGNFYTIGLSPGYAYTFVFLKYIYLTAAIFPGVAAQFSEYNHGNFFHSEFEFSFQLSGRFAIGYNSDKWFAGASAQTGFSEVPDKLSKSLFNYDVAQYRIWGGTRFNIFKKKHKNRNGQ